MAAKGVVPDNTKRCNYWAEKNFSDWAKSRREKVPQEPIPDNLLSCNDAASVNKWLCHYVLETQQESGKPSPPKTLYSLLCGLLRITRSNKVPFNFFDKSDATFHELHLTLDIVCSELHSYIYIYIYI